MTAVWAVLLLLLLLLLSVLCNGYRLNQRRPDANTCKSNGVDPGQPLLLTPLIQSGNYAAARAASRATLDGVSLGHSGFISVPSASGKNTNNLFFWYQPCVKCNASQAEFILWLQGGPGAPSTYGSLQEIGPLYITDKCKIAGRCNTWCHSHSCLFIDNPVQTGFSYQVNATGQNDPANIEYTATSRDAALQIRGLLDQLLLVFPELKPAPFWVTGESYGGNYCANVAQTIVQTNTPSNRINLVGVSVGDPVMNSFAQWPTYGNTLYGMGLVNILQRELINSVMSKGLTAMATQSCKAGFDFWNQVWNDNGEAPSPFYYQQFSGSNTTYEQLLTTDPDSQNWSINWLSLPQVQAAMHFGNSPANQQNEGGPVYDTMVQSGDFCQNSSDIYAWLLVEAGIHVQIYSSSNDPLLGPPCTEAGINAMMVKAAMLSGSSQVLNIWNNAPRVLWKDPQQLSGYASCFTYAPRQSRFCYPVIRNAGHMAPAFQPRAALDMTLRFIRNISYSSLGPPLPNCLQCGGSPPFTGSAICGCNL